MECGKCLVSLGYVNGCGASDPTLDTWSRMKVVNVWRNWSASDSIQLYPNLTYGASEIPRKLVPWEWWRFTSRNFRVLAVLTLWLCLLSSQRNWLTSWRSATLSLQACLPWRWSWNLLPLASLITSATPTTSLTVSSSSSGDKGLGDPLKYILKGALQSLHIFMCLFKNDLAALLGGAELMHKAKNWETKMSFPNTWWP